MMVGVALAGCQTPKPAASASAGGSPCLPVVVHDEHGAPLAGATLHAEVQAWSGPEGAFYTEGGNLLQVTGAKSTSGNDGMACIEDPTAKLLGMQKRAATAADTATRGSAGFVYYGGFGPLRIGAPRGIAVHATVPGMAPTKTNLGPAPGPRAEPTRIVVGPPRRLTVLVRSHCDATTVRITAQSPHQDPVQGIRDSSVPGSGAYAAGFRFEGLGPLPYTLHTLTCDGAYDETPFTPHVNGEHHEIDLLHAKREVPTSP